MKLLLLVTLFFACIGIAALTCWLMSEQKPEVESLDTTAKTIEDLVTPCMNAFLVRALQEECSLPENIMLFERDLSVQLNRPIAAKELVVCVKYGLEAIEKLLTILEKTPAESREESRKAMIEGLSEEIHPHNNN